MKITVENISKEYPKIKIPLPEPLAKEKFDKLKSTFLPNYDKSEVIKKMVDTFVVKLNEVLAKASPKKAKGQKATPKKESKREIPVVNERRPVFENLPANHPLNLLEVGSPQYIQAYDEWKETTSWGKIGKKEASKTKSRKRSEKPAAKAKKQTCTAKNQAEKIESYPEDIRLIRRFFVAVGKERQRRTILNIYRDLEKRITERKVNKECAHAALIWEISGKLKKVLDAMSAKGLTHVTIVPATGTEQAALKSQHFFKEVESVARGKEIRSSVNLLKRFIGIEGEVAPDKKKVKRIVDAFESAMKRGKICDSDLYFSEFKEANAAMNSYLEGKAKNITISPTGLRGLEKIAGLGKPKATVKRKKPVIGGGQKKKTRKPGNNVAKTNRIVKGARERSVIHVAQEPVILNRFQVNISRREPVFVSHRQVIETPKDPALDGLFTPIMYNSPDNAHQKIDLPGDLGRFLGYVERYEYSILLRGEKGAGKTRMLYQMMNTFALAGFKVGSFSLEIGKQSNLIRDMRNQYISPTIANNVFIADSVPNGLDDIRAAAKQFDVICIDSWGKIPGTKADDFDKLRKEFPKTMFVIIFQSTTNGTARGGSMPEYDAGVVIQVANGGRAICEKNRYNGEDLTYLVFQRKLEEQLKIS